MQTAASLLSTFIPGEVLGMPFIRAGKGISGLSFFSPVTIMVLSFLIEKQFSGLKEEAGGW